MYWEMSADPADRRQLGKLLVDKGLLTEAQLQLALAEQAASGAPLGEVLVRLGFSRGPTIGNALAEQHGGPLRTEYGLALGPSDVTAAPRPIKTPEAPPADRAGLVRLREPSPEQSTAVARISTTLDERTQELELVRAELAAVKQHQPELATLHDQLASAQEERARAEQELARSETALTQVDQERAQYAARLEELQLQLDAARSEREEIGDSRRVQRELELTLQQLKIEAKTIQAELTQALEERTALANRAQELELALKRQDVELARAADERARSEESLTLALTRSEARLAQADQEREVHANRLTKAEQQLDASRSDSDEIAATRRARRELDLAVEQHKAEVEALTAELVRALEERTTHANRARTLEEKLEQALARDSDSAERQRTAEELKLLLERQAVELARAREERTAVLDRARELEALESPGKPAAMTVRWNDDDDDSKRVDPELQRALVATATARAQRRYGPALRTADTEESTSVDDDLDAAHRDEPADSRQSDNAAKQNSLRELELVVRQQKAQLEAIAADLGHPGPPEAGVHAERGYAIRLWQLAGLIVLASLALYFVVGGKRLVAAVFAALLVAFIVMVVVRMRVAKQAIAGGGPAGLKAER